MTTTPPLMTSILSFEDERRGYRGNLGSPTDGWIQFRQEERDDLMPQIAALQKKIHDYTAALAPKPVAATNAWQPKSMLRTKNMVSALTPAQERDAALILQRKREDEQREENRKARGQGRTPTILYPELGSLQWIEHADKRAANAAGMRLAQTSLSVAPPPDLRKELAAVEMQHSKLTQRLAKVDADIVAFQASIRDDIASAQWKASGFKGPVPAHIQAAQARWMAELSAGLDTALPLRGHSSWGKAASVWIGGERPAVPVKKVFSWEDIYVPSDSDEEDEDEEAAIAAAAWDEYETA
jgi:hypothetical protein